MHNPDQFELKAHECHCKPPGTRGHIHVCPIHPNVHWLPNKRLRGIHKYGPWFTNVISCLEPGLGCSVYQGRHCQYQCLKCNEYLWFCSFEEYIQSFTRASAANTNTSSAINICDFVHLRSIYSPLPGPALLIPTPQVQPISVTLFIWGVYIVLYQGQRCQYQHLKCNQYLWLCSFEEYIPSFTRVSAANTNT
jgi:hypothetical protein